MVVPPPNSMTALLRKPFFPSFTGEIANGGNGAFMRQICTAALWVFPNVSLTMVWWCKGVDVVGQTSMLRGAVQPSSLSLLSRLYSSFCSLCVQILPAACIHCTHFVSCVYFCWPEKQVYITATASWGHHSRVFLSLCGITAGYNSIKHWVLHPQLE